MSEFCVVTTTTDNPDHARALAGQIVEHRLGACVQIQPIESHYVWQGRQEQASEWQLSIKTRSALYDELERFIRARHHYETPQLLCTPVLAGQVAYLAWVRQETHAQGEQA